MADYQMDQPTGSSIKTATLGHVSDSINTPGRDFKTHLPESRQTNLQEVVLTIDSKGMKQHSSEKPATLMNSQKVDSELGLAQDKSPRLEQSQHEQKLNQEPRIESKRGTVKQQMLTAKPDFNRSSVGVSTQSLLQSNGDKSKDDQTTQQVLDDYLKEHILRHGLIGFDQQIEPPKPTPLDLYSSKYLGLDAVVSHYKTETMLHKKSNQHQATLLLPKVQQLQHRHQNFTPLSPAQVASAYQGASAMTGNKTTHLESIMSSDAMMTPVGIQDQTSGGNHTRGLSAHTFGDEQSKQIDTINNKTQATAFFSATDKAAAQQAQQEYQMAYDNVPAEGSQDRVAVYSRQNVVDDVSFRATATNRNQQAPSASGPQYYENQFGQYQHGGSAMELAHHDSMHSLNGGHGTASSRYMMNLNSIVSMEAKDTGRQSTTTGPALMQSKGPLTNLNSMSVAQYQSMQQEYMPLVHSSAKERFFELQSRAREREDKQKAQNERLLAKFLKRTNPDAHMARKLERQFIRQQNIEAALNSGCLILNAKAHRHEGARAGAQTELSSYLEYRGKQISAQEKAISKAQRRERRYLEKILRRHQRAHARSQLERVADGGMSTIDQLEERQPPNLSAQQKIDFKVSIDATDDGGTYLSRRILEVSKSAEDSAMPTSPNNAGTVMRPSDLAASDATARQAQLDSHRDYNTQAEAIQDIMSKSTSVRGAIHVKNALKARSSVPQRQMNLTKRMSNSDLAVLDDKKGSTSDLKDLLKPEEDRKMNVTTPRQETTMSAVEGAGGTSESEAQSRATILPHKFSGIKSFQVNDIKLADSNARRTPVEEDSDAVGAKIHPQAAIGSIINHAMDMNHMAITEEQNYVSITGDKQPRSRAFSVDKDEPAKEYDVSSRQMSVPDQRRSEQNFNRQVSGSSNIQTLGRVTKDKGTPRAHSTIASKKGALRYSHDEPGHSAASMEISLITKDQGVQPYSQKGKLLTEEQLHNLFEYYRQTYLSSMSIDQVRDYLAKGAAPVMTPDKQQIVGRGLSNQATVSTQIHSTLPWDEAAKTDGFGLKEAKKVRNADSLSFKYKQRSHHRETISEMRGGSRSSRGEREATLTQGSEGDTDRSGQAAIPRPSTTTTLPSGTKVRRLPSELERAIENQRQNDMNHYLEEFTKVMGHAPPGGLAGWMFLQGLYNQYMYTKRLQELQSRLEDLDKGEQMIMMANQQEQVRPVTSISEFNANDSVPRPLTELADKLSAKELRRHAYARSSTWLRNKRARRLKAAATQEGARQPGTQPGAALPAVLNYKQRVIEKQLSKLRETLNDHSSTDMNHSTSQQDRAPLSRSSIWQVQMQHAKLMQERAAEEAKTVARSSKSALALTRADSPSLVNPISRSLIELQGRGVRATNISQLLQNVLPQQSQVGFSRRSNIVMPAVATQSSTSSRGAMSSRAPLMLSSNQIQKLQCEIPGPDRRFNLALNPVRRRTGGRQLPRALPQISSKKYGHGTTINTLNRKLPSQSQGALPRHGAAKVSLPPSSLGASKSFFALNAGETVLTAKPTSAEDDARSLEQRASNLSGSVPQSTIHLPDRARGLAISPEKTRIFIENQTKAGLTASGDGHNQGQQDAQPLRSKSEQRLMGMTPGQIAADTRPYDAVTGTQVTDESPLHVLPVIGGFGQEVSSVMMPDGSRDIQRLGSSVVNSSSGPPLEAPAAQTARQLSLAHKTERHEGRAYGRRQSVIPENLNSSMHSEKTEVKGHSRVNSSTSQVDLPSELRRASESSHPYYVHATTVLLQKANQISLYRSGERHGTESGVESGGTPVLSASVVKHKAMSSQGRRRVGASTIVDSSFVDRVDTNVLVKQKTEHYAGQGDTEVRQSRTNLRSEQAGQRGTAKAVFSTSRPRSSGKRDAAPKETERISSRSSKPRGTSKRGDVSGRQHPQKSSARESRNTLNHGGTLPPINIVGSQQHDASSNHDLSQVMTPRGTAHVALDLRARKVSLRKTAESTGRVLNGIASNVLPRNANSSEKQLLGKKITQNLYEDEEATGQLGASKSDTLQAVESEQQLNTLADAVDQRSQGTAAVLAYRQADPARTATELTSAPARTTAMPFAPSLVTPPLVNEASAAASVDDGVATLLTNAASRPSYGQSNLKGSRGNLSKDSAGRLVPRTEENWRYNDDHSTTLAVTQKPRAEIVRKTLSRMQREHKRDQSPDATEGRRASEASQLVKSRASSYLPMQVSAIQKPEKADSGVIVSQQESSGFITVSTLVTKKAARSHVLLPGLMHKQAAADEQGAKKKRGKKKLMPSKSALRISGEATGQVLPRGVSKAELISATAKRTQEPLIAQSRLEDSNVEIHVRHDVSASNEVSDRKLQPIGTSASERPEYELRSVDVPGANPMRQAITEEAAMIAQQMASASMDDGGTLPPAHITDTLPRRESVPELSIKHVHTEYRPQGSFRELRQTSYGFAANLDAKNSDLDNNARTGKAADGQHRRYPGGSRARQRHDSAGDAKRESLTSELTVLGTRKTMVGRSKDRGSLDAGLTVVDQQALRSEHANKSRIQHNSQPRQSRSQTRGSSILAHKKSIMDANTPQLYEQPSIEPSDEYRKKHETIATRPAHRERSSDLTSSNQMTHQSGITPGTAIFNQTHLAVGSAAATLPNKNGDLPDYVDGVDLASRQPSAPVSGSVTPAQSTKRLRAGPSTATDEPSLERPSQLDITGKNLFASIMDNEAKKAIAPRNAVVAAANIQSQNVVNKDEETKDDEPTANSASGEVDGKKPKRGGRLSSKRASLQSETGSVIMPMDSNLPIMLFNDSFAAHPQDSQPTQSIQSYNSKPMSQGRGQTELKYLSMQSHQTSGRAETKQPAAAKAVKATTVENTPVHVPRAGMRGSKLTAQRMSSSSLRHQK